MTPMRGILLKQEIWPFPEGEAPWYYHVGSASLTDHHQDKHEGYLHVTVERTLDATSLESLIGDASPTLPPLLHFDWGNKNEFWLISNQLLAKLESSGERFLATTALGERNRQTNYDIDATMTEWQSGRFELRQW